MPEGSRPGSGGGGGGVLRGMEASISRSMLCALSLALRACEISANLVDRAISSQDLGKTCSANSISQWYVAAAPPSASENCLCHGAGCCVMCYHLYMSWQPAAVGTQAADRVHKLCCSVHVTDDCGVQMSSWLGTGDRPSSWQTRFVSMSPPAAAGTMADDQVGIPDGRLCTSYTECTPA